MTLRAWVQVDAALKQVAVEVRYQGANVARRVWTLLFWHILLAVLDILFHTHREANIVALVNGILGNFEIFGAQITLQRLLGWFFSPIAWLIGIPWPEAGIAGSLLGTKLVLNELVAYIQLSEVSPLLSENSRVVMVFALCGFANFGSLGILLGGLYFLIPERQDEVVVMAPKSIASGTMVTLMTGSIVSLVISF